MPRSRRAFASPGARGGVASKTPPAPGRVSSVQKQGRTIELLSHRSRTGGTPRSRPRSAFQGGTGMVRILNRRIVPGNRRRARPVSFGESGARPAPPVPTRFALPLARDPLDRHDPPVNDSPLEPAAAAPSPAAPPTEAPATPAPAVPGERLGVPYGATRVFHDYGRPAPSYFFLAIVSVLTFAADIST